MALDLVTRYRMRLVDPADSRLGPLAGRYVLGAASWTGPTAALVGFYEPGQDGAAEELRQRLAEARAWAEQRLPVQGAQRAHVLLVALGPVAGPPAPEASPAGDAVRVGAATVDADTGAVTVLGKPVPGLPGLRELRRAAETVVRGGPVPTLAAVDLAERQTVAGGAAATTRRIVTEPPRATIGLIAACVAGYGLEILALQHFQTPTGADEGPALNAMYLAVGAIPSTGADWWRVVSAGFVHASPVGGGLGILHILSNCFGLWVLGRPIEQIFGRLALVATFLASVIGGNLAYLAVHHGEPGIAFGASGGVFGLIGLVAMLGRVQGKSLSPGATAALRQWAMTTAGFNLIFGFTAGQLAGINNSAHIGGLVTGVLIGVALPVRAELGGRPLRRAEQGVMLALAVFAAVALGVAVTHLVDQLTQTYVPARPVFPLG